MISKDTLPLNEYIIVSLLNEGKDLSLAIKYFNLIKKIIKYCEKILNYNNKKINFVKF